MKILLPALALLIAEAGMSGGAQAAPRPAAKPQPPRTVVVPPAMRTMTLPGMRHLPGSPLLIGAVQVNAADNFLRMLTGGQSKNSSGADMMMGALQLLKDQIDGPLSVGLYADAAGKPGSVLMAAHLKSSGLTRELLGGFVTLSGDEKNPARKTEYKGQTLISMDLPKSQGTKLPFPLQPTFTVTNTEYLLIGTNVDVVRRSVDAGATTGSGLMSRTDVAAMLREFPLSSGTDVWLFMPKPTGGVAGAKPPFPLPIAGLPIGATAVAIRFTPTGVRFEGLASMDRTRPTRATR